MGNGMYTTKSDPRQRVQNLEYIRLEQTTAINTRLAKSPLDRSERLPEPVMMKCVVCGFEHELNQLCQNPTG